MLDDYNYQERVSLLGNLQGEAWAEAESGITLAEAVRTVVEEWDLRTDDRHDPSRRQRNFLGRRDPRHLRPR